MKRTVETSHLFKIRARDVVPERTEQMAKVTLIYLSSFDHIILYMLMP